MIGCLTMRRWYLGLINKYSSSIIDLHQLTAIDAKCGLQRARGAVAAYISISDRVSEQVQTLVRHA